MRSPWKCRPLSLSSQGSPRDKSPISSPASSTPGSKEGMDRVQIRIDEDGRKVTRATGDNKNVWPEAFLNYTMILVTAFISKNSNHLALYFAQTNFHRNHRSFLQVSMAPSARFLHPRGLPTDTAQWEILTKWQVDPAIHWRTWPSLRAGAPTFIILPPLTHLPLRKQKMPTNLQSSVSPSIEEKCKRAKCRSARIVHLRIMNIGDATRSEKSSGWKSWKMR